MSNDPNNPCLFCRPSVKAEWLLSENEHAMLWADSNPVSNGHCLAIPHRHVADYFDLTREEREAIEALLHQRRATLMAEDDSIDGFNVGVNCGKAAGQSIRHVHVHLIPRRFGDNPKPQGGVRHVIPDKAYYQRKNKD
ncbi:MAG: HIT family protein [Magnetococcales bacterium]|nr:HIT family protein [Magnetococcales bacterium]